MLEMTTQNDNPSISFDIDNIPIPDSPYLTPSPSPINGDNTFSLLI